jgi:hypothetical protein
LPKNPSFSPKTRPSPIARLADLPLFRLITQSIVKKFHIATAEGQNEYEEALARMLWRQGKIPPNAKFWIQGMADWRPLSEYFGPNTVDQNPYSPPSALDQPVISEVRGLTYTKSPHALTRFVVIMLWLSLACEIVSVLSELAQFSLLSRAYTAAEAEANDSRQQMIAWGYFIVFLATSIPFLRWIHRANLNCRGFGARDMTFTPGWSAGSFFVPFLNLVRPNQAMKEIWQASNNPFNWKGQPGSPILGWWWGLWLASGLIGQVSLQFTKHAETIDELKATTLIAIGENLVGIPLCLAALAMIRRIYKSQEALVNRADAGTR